MHGLYKKSYSDGTFQIAWHNEGVPDGLFRQYDKDDKMTDEAYFDNDKYYSSLQEVPVVKKAVVLE